MLLQIVTDSLDTPVIALDESLESAARGAAMLALSNILPALVPFDPVDGALVTTPDPARVARYAVERARQNRLLALFERPDSPWYAAG